MIDVLPRWRSPSWDADTIRDHLSTTPGRLRLLSLLVAGGSALLWLAGSTVLGGSADALGRIGRGTVPAVVLTQQIHAALADADRSAANAFLAGGVEIVEPRTQYEVDIATAAHELEQAAEHNRAGGQASLQLQTIDALVARYTGLVEEARANNRQGFPISVAYLRDASLLMHRPDDGILARVDALGALDAGDLAGQEAELTFSLGLVWAFLALAAGLAGVLAYTQAFLRGRFHRRLNDGLLAATALLLVLSAWTSVLGVHTAVAAGDARQAYGRLDDLWRARSLANDADGNVSLSLAAVGNGGDFDRAFADQTRQLVDRPLTDRLVADAARGHVGFHGLLATALQEASFPGERDAALRALRSYQQFLAEAAAVRAAVASGDQAGAVTIALGTRPGQLAVVFGELDEALDDVVAIDQQRFDSSVDAAGSALGLDLGLPLLAAAITLLTFWGLQPRIAEYRT